MRILLIILFMLFFTKSYTQDFWSSGNSILPSMIKVNDTLMIATNPVTIEDFANYKEFLINHSYSKITDTLGKLNKSGLNYNKFIASLPKRNETSDLQYLLENTTFNIYDTTYLIKQQEQKSVTAFLRFDIDSNLNKNLTRLYTKEDVENIVSFSNNINFKNYGVISFKTVFTTNENCTYGSSGSLTDRYEYSTWINKRAWLNVKNTNFGNSQKYPDGLDFLDDFLEGVRYNYGDSLLTSRDVYSNSNITKFYGENFLNFKTIKQSLYYHRSSIYPCIDVNSFVKKYPIIYIDQKVAENYCKWVNSMIYLEYYSNKSKKDDNKHKKFIVRLPKEEEFKLAIFKNDYEDNIFYQPLLTYSPYKDYNKSIKTNIVKKADDCTHLNSQFDADLLIPKKQNTLLIPSNNISEWLHEENKIIGLGWIDKLCSLPYNVIRTQSSATDWIGFRCVCVVKEE